MFMYVLRMFTCVLNLTSVRKIQVFLYTRYSVIPCTRTHAADYTRLYREHVACYSVEMTAQKKELCLSSTQIYRREKVGKCYMVASATPFSGNTT